ncbi:Hypothetical predicted protein [Olea europaea subsp. europaea]|uniref:Uncharacterized protein n=1 Tax=Olea europaea subsp. europaea TaxID=158383 RepID=A0A8S0RF63_OLEEU|nr:Hypothetical predicted protein [Olea europaea subsp. europaea]
MISPLDINKVTAAAYLHVYATLRPTEAERGQPYIATLVSLDDRPVPALDDLARDSVASQFHAERVGTPEEGTSEDETSNEAHEGNETSGEASSTSYAQSTTTVGLSLTIDDVQGMLLDQRILIEMQLRTVKLEIMQHVSDEFKKLRTSYPLSSPYPTLQPLHTMQATTRRLMVQTKTWRLTGKREMVCALLKNTWSHARTSKTCHCPLEPKVCKALERGHHSSPSDHDEDRDMLPTGTEYLQNTADIEPCPNNDSVPVPAGTDEVQVIPSFIKN